MDLARFRHGMLTQWVGFCLTDPGLLQGILLASSQYFVNLHYSSGNNEEGNRFQQRALYHRGQLLRSMSDSMSQDTRDLTDNIVAKGMFLAFNEVCDAAFLPPSTNRFTGQLLTLMEFSIWRATSQIRCDT